MRLLFLDGADGSVACRVHGRQQQSTWPRISMHKRLECATRSFLRLRNLVAVRGSRGASMVGPTDYYGNLENPDRYSYIITIDHDGWPRIYRQNTTKRVSSQVGFSIEPYIITITLTWLSGTCRGGTDPLKSLFPKLGTGVVTPLVLSLPHFDARGADLSSFRARLVPNERPFSITNQPVSPSDEFRMIAYEYGSHYANDYPENLFLERHSFAQTITPLRPTCSGYLLLARHVCNERFEIISISIPFGYTLIVDPFCIHGDATLVGKYLMGMTSNHVTMQTADTVLLRGPCGRPISLQRTPMTDTTTTTDTIESNTANNDDEDAFVWYYSDDAQRVKELRERVRNCSVIFNPLSKGYLNV